GREIGGRGQPLRHRLGLSGRGLRHGGGDEARGFGRGGGRGRRVVLYQQLHDGRGDFLRLRRDDDGDRRRQRGRGLRDDLRARFGKRRCLRERFHHRRRDGHGLIGRGG